MHESLLGDILGILSVRTVIAAVGQNIFVISAHKNLKSIILALLHFSDQKEIGIQSFLLFVLPPDIRVCPGAFLLCGCFSHSIMYNDAGREKDSVK